MRLPYNSRLFIRVLRTIQTTITIPDDFQRAFMTEIEQFQVSLKEIKVVINEYRGVLFEFHHKFWNTASIGIPARSLL